MAKTGFEYIVVGKLDESVSKSCETAAYTEGMYLGPSSTFNGTPSANDVKDYGDDRAVETDTSVSGGTLSVELNESTLEIKSFLLGHSHAEENGMVSNANDIAPYIGIGAVGKSKRNNKYKYTGKFYLKVQFREPGDDNQTKQENVTFTHTTLEGSLFTLENGDWKDEKEFETLAEAKAWLDQKVGIMGES